MSLSYIDPLVVSIVITIFKIRWNIIPRLLLIEGAKCKIFVNFVIRIHQLHCHRSAQQRMPSRSSLSDI